MTSRSSCRSECKAKDLFAFIELPKDILVAREPESSTAARRRAAKREGTAEEDAEEGPTFKFYAQTTSARPVTRWLEDAVNQAVAQHRFTTAGIDQALVEETHLVRDVHAVRPGRAIGRRDGRAAKEMDEIARVGLPVFALVLMFMGVMTGAMHLLNAIIEEKMSKISEVLLGSVTPFQLLAGKLVGVVARVAAADARLPRSAASTRCCRSAGWISSTPCSSAGFWCSWSAPR